jgi:hypothetical protein
MMLSEIKKIAELRAKAAGGLWSPVFSQRTGWVFGHIRQHVAKPHDPTYEDIDFATAAANLNWQRLTDYIAALEDVAGAAGLALDTLMSGMGAGGLPGLQASAIRLQAAEILDNSLAKLDALEKP